MGPASGRSRPKRAGVAILIAAGQGGGVTVTVTKTGRWTSAVATQLLAEPAATPSAAVLGSGRAERQGGRVRCPDTGPAGAASRRTISAPQPAVHH